MALLMRDFRTTDRTVLDARYFERRFRLLVETITDLEGRLEALKESDDALIALGIDRINEAIGPATERLQAAASGGFLSGTSSTELTLTTGGGATLYFDDNGALDVFEPTPFVTLTRDAAGSHEQYATGRVDTWFPETGQLVLTDLIVSPLLEGGTYSDWHISASGGLAGTVLQAAANVAATLSEAEAATQAAAQAVTDVEALIAAGAVFSVNGQTGEVSLQIGDIPNLVATLAGKAAASHGHTGADSIDGGTY